MRALRSAQCETVLVEVYDFPDYGHELPHTMYNDKVKAIFNKSVNTSEPNLGVIRHLFMSRVKELKEKP